MGAVPRTLLATAYYEALRATRARVLWWALTPLTALAVLLALTSGRITGLDDPSQRAGETAVVFSLLCALGVAIGLTDRFAAHRRSGLTEVLDATAAGGVVRVIGALFGSLAVALAVPVGAFAVLTVVTAITTGTTTALAAGMLAVVTILLPASLVSTTFAALLGNLVPVAIARVITVFVWLWATVLNPALLPVPTITGTVLSPLGRYPAAAWLHSTGSSATYGLDGALRPTPTSATALLAVLIPLVASAVFLGLTTAVLARRR